MPFQLQKISLEAIIISRIFEDISGGFPHSSVGKESACNAGGLGSIPGSGRSLGEGNGNPLQYSCLENPHGRRILVGYSRGFAKSQTRLKWLSTHAHAYKDWPAPPNDSNIHLAPQAWSLLLCVPIGLTTSSLCVLVINCLSVLSTLWASIPAGTRACLNSLNLWQYLKWSGSSMHAGWVSERVLSLIITFFDLWDQLSRTFTFLFFKTKHGGAGAYELPSLRPRVNSQDPEWGPQKFLLLSRADGDCNASSRWA